LGPLALPRPDATTAHAAHTPRTKSCGCTHGHRRASIWQRERPYPCRTALQNRTCWASCTQSRDGQGRPGRLTARHKLHAVFTAEASRPPVVPNPPLEGPVHQSSRHPPTIRPKDRELHAKGMRRGGGGGGGARRRKPNAQKKAADARAPIRGSRGASFLQPSSTRWLQRGHSFTDLAEALEALRVGVPDGRACILVGAVGALPSRVGHLRRRRHSTRRGGSLGRLSRGQLSPPLLGRDWLRPDGLRSDWLGCGGREMCSFTSLGQRPPRAKRSRLLRGRRGTLRQVERRLLWLRRRSRHVRLLWRWCVLRRWLGR